MAKESTLLELDNSARTTLLSTRTHLLTRKKSHFPSW